MKTVCTSRRLHIIDWLSNMSGPLQKNMTIILSILGKVRTLMRPKDEPLSKSLFRIRQSAIPPSKGTKRKKKPEGFGLKNGGVEPRTGEQEASRADKEEEEPTEPVVLLRHEGDVDVDESTLNARAWMHGSILRVGSNLLTVVVNPPCVDTLKLPLCPIVGVPQTAQVSVMDADDIEDSCWEWERGKPSESGSVDWEAVPESGGRMYLPNSEDAGYSLRVTLTPRRRRIDGGAGSHISGESKTSAATEMVQVNLPPSTLLIKCDVLV